MRGRSVDDSQAHDGDNCITNSKYKNNVQYMVVEIRNKMNGLGREMPVVYKQNPGSEINSIDANRNR